MLWQFTFNVSDAGIAVLIVFLHQILKLFHSIAANNATAELIGQLPSTLQQVRDKVLGNSIRFTTYIVCSKCHSLYDSDNSTEKVGIRITTKKCQYISFPNHPMFQFRQPCGTALLRKLLRADHFQPFKTYPYQSLKDAIARLLKRQGFLEKCEHWRKRISLSDYLSDIYDGQVWSDFSTFLSQPYSWCLALNVDWFQPFSHICDSVGAIYLVILNLPRKERYKRENMILVGIIPGPKEPSLTINSYLTPLVYELKEFYKGVIVPCISPDGKHIRSVVIKLVLTCIVCDLPATRKVCGFVSFSGYRGCSRCLKSFPTVSFGDGADYSGYDREKWPERDITIHKQKSYEHRDSNTKADQKHIEKEFGIRYSVLIELPYFNPIKYAVIDPMHNLFLGTAKYCMQYWINKDILSKNDIGIIEKRVSSLIAPHNIGRLPNKISSGFAGFSADQWRNWTICYSSIALRDVLPRQHLQY